MNKRLKTAQKSKLMTSMQPPIKTTIALLNENFKTETSYEAH